MIPTGTLCIIVRDIPVDGLAFPLHVGRTCMVTGHDPWDDAGMVNVVDIPGSPYELLGDHNWQYADAELCPIAPPGVPVDAPERVPEDVSA